MSMHMLQVKKKAVHMRFTGALEKGALKRMHMCPDWLVAVMTALAVLPLLRHNEVVLFQQPGVRGKQELR